MSISMGTFIFLNKDKIFKNDVETTNKQIFDDKLISVSFYKKKEENIADEKNIKKYTLTYRIYDTIKT